MPLDQLLSESVGAITKNKNQATLLSLLIGGLISTPKTSNPEHQYEIEMLNSHTRRARVKQERFKNVIDFYFLSGVLQVLPERMHR